MSTSYEPHHPSLTWISKKCSVDDYTVVQDEELYVASTIQGSQSHPKRIHDDLVRSMSLLSSWRLVLR